MAEKKPLYIVALISKYGTWGLQPVKADTQNEARRKFKKRFPKSRIIGVEKAGEDYKPIIDPI